MVRVILIPVFLLLLYLDFEYKGFPVGKYIAVFVFFIAALTDLADGLIARKRNQITDFGKFMDPLADKILTFAAMLWFVGVGMMPAWLVLVVIIREFLVTGIRLVAAAKGRVIAATMSGKVKTVVTIVCIITMFLAIDLEAIAAFFGLIFPIEHWLLILCWVLIGVTTLISGVEYLVKNKDIMKMEM